ncbi:MAG: FAD:protein FMN transferase [Elusimicrobia bacterium]|nr:FAD:protein FMN transferase [Elusimicrobiota bacterium]
MDSFVILQIPEEEASDEVFELAFKRLTEVYEKFTAHLEGTPIEKFNKGKENIDDEEIIFLIKESIRIGSLSGGAFDITLFPLMELWGFYSADYSLPENEKLEETLLLTGLDKLEFNDMGELVCGRVKIDLGGIAKGYAVDEAAAALRQAGIKNALFDAGGDIYALGFRDERNKLPWRVGIKDPHGEGIINLIGISDKAVATSGEYERRFELGGKSYHHILNPASGRPAEGKSSVTVIAPTAKKADAWATALFVMEVDPALELASKTEDLEVLIITSTGEKLSTPGFGELIID